MLKEGQRVKLVGRRWFYYCGLRRIEMVGRVIEQIPTRTHTDGAFACVLEHSAADN